MRSIENILRRSVDNIKKTDSNNSVFTLGSFQVGRSNIFKGHIDTVPDTGFLSPAVVYAEITSPGVKVRRSEFSRITKVDAAASPKEPIHGKGDSQSISINISIVKSDVTSNANSREEVNITKSSRSLSKHSNMSKTVVGSDVPEIQKEDEETIDSKKERDPLSIHVLRLLNSGNFKNPFDDFYDDYGVSQRIEKINMSSVTSRSIAHPKGVNMISGKFKSDFNIFETESVMSSQNCRGRNMDSSRKNFI
jgi:hypothetical protein